MKGQIVGPPCVPPACPVLAFACVDDEVFGPPLPQTWQLLLLSARIRGMNAGCQAHVPIGMRRPKLKVQMVDDRALQRCYCAGVLGL